MFASYESELVEVKKTLKGYVQSIPTAKGGLSHLFAFLLHAPIISHGFCVYLDERLQQIDAAHEALEQAQDLVCSKKAIHHLI